MSEQGAGPISVADVGVYTIAKTSVITTRKAMAYAAGINDTNPAYFDDLRESGVLVHPGICFSLQWAARFMPDRKLNLRAAPFGVHAETDLRLYRPFRVGEAVTTQGRLVARTQIGPGVYSVDRYKMSSSDGELIAELDYNGIFRGGVLDGDNRELEPSLKVPALPATTEEPLWQKQVYIPLHAGQQYTECADIYNPIHTEPSAARAGGLPGVILHGSATKAIALSAVIDNCFSGDASCIRRLCGQLRGMVLMDSEITIECHAVIDVGKERQVFYSVKNAAGDDAIAGGVVCGVIQ